jgi:HSP20 family protein
VLKGDSRKKDESGKREAAANGMAFGLGGILKGLGDLVEKLGEMENSEQFSKTGELKGIYGFTVKVGLGGDKPTVEPFGNIRKDRNSGNTVVQEVREPLVDIFEEDDHILIVAEMPGVSAEDVRVELAKDLVTFTAEHGEKKYRKEVLLPGSVKDVPPQVVCHNGVLEIKFAK